MKNIGKLPWVVLIVSLSVTSLIWFSFSYSETSIEKTEFETNSKIMTLQIQKHLEEYELILIGAKGLFSASEKVEYDEWSNYIKIQNVDKKFPGIQGVGYIHHITNDERDDLIKELESYGITDYTITPEWIRVEYYPVVYLEPLDFRNQRAMGYDIYVEEKRQQAVETLRNTGDTTITGKLILVQETENDIQNGFLMLVPIYPNESSSSVNSYDLQGIVYAVFRMNDFMKSVLEPNAFDYTNLKIYDETELEENLLFDSKLLNQKEIGNKEYSLKTTLSVGNRDWIFVYEGIQPPYLGIEHQISIIIPFLGISISAIAFYFTRIFVHNIKLSRGAIRNEKASAMGMMASRIAHDIRNPLAIISVCQENLKTGKGTNELKQKQLDKIERAVNTINNIIQDVLNFAQTENIRREITSTNVILNNSIKDINIPDRVDIQLPKKDFSINCDKSKMQSVFLNLISNSIQAIKGHGKITIDVKETNKKTIITVEDSGSGIPKEKLLEVFEPMYTTKKLGTGLGLSICKNIIEEHGGTISVSNNPTKFQIGLPKRV
ncbi:MAG: CHASE domain-containing protein [Nitrosopumilus sp.]|nr:CHASE domain-containing protein [Nitrosopumilus sp.]